MLQHILVLSLLAWCVRADDACPNAFPSSIISGTLALSLATQRILLRQSNGSYTAGGGFQSPIEIPVPLGAFALAAGDFNGDGKTDLAVLISQSATAAADGVLILAGNGDGTFTDDSSYPAGPFAQAIIAVTSTAMGNRIWWWWTQAPTRGNTWTVMFCC